jgi:ergothioneine biosynthesis protein EgtB
MVTEFAPVLSLAQRFSSVREETDRLFGILNASVLYARPIPERHRIIFYVGHLEAFDWNLLRGILKLAPFHTEFDRLFAFGIDPVDGGLPNDQPEDWPSTHEVENYRQQIRQRLDAALSAVTDSEELVQLTNIAIEHRLMHAETLEYMFHQLPYSGKVGLDAPAAVASGVIAAGIADVPAGMTALGLDRKLGQFGWDNEFELHTVEVPAFSIGKHKVTNREFAAFVEDGGYTRRSLWGESDWEWITKSQISHPGFWVPAADGFRYRGMFEEVLLPLDAPVYVSHAEASAYARWEGKDLPTEEEWHRAAHGAKPPAETRKLWNAPAVGSHHALRSAYGVEGLLGTGWEWTSTKFAPFPGFEITPAYPGYSAPFFDGKHYVLKGGSVRTAACLLRKSFRNWFQAHYQYVYAGFRCVAR